MMSNTASGAKIFAINPDLQKQVSPVLTNMVATLLKKKPQDPVSANSLHTICSSTCDCFPRCEI